jgi:hypothetical protein
MQDYGVALSRLRRPSYEKSFRFTISAKRGAGCLRIGAAF